MCILTKLHISAFCNHALSCASSMIEKYIIFIMFAFDFKFFFQFQFTSFLLPTCELQSDLNYDLHFCCFLHVELGWRKLEIYFKSRRSRAIAARRSECDLWRRLSFHIHLTNHNSCRILNWAIDDSQSLPHFNHCGIYAKPILFNFEFYFISINFAVFVYFLICVSFYSSHHHRIGHSE